MLSELPCGRQLLQRRKCEWAMLCCAPFIFVFLGCFNIAAPSGLLFGERMFSQLCIHSWVSGRDSARLSAFCILSVSWSRALFGTCLYFDVVISCYYYRTIIIKLLLFILLFICRIVSTCSDALLLYLFHKGAPPCLSLPCPPINCSEGYDGPMCNGLFSFFYFFNPKIL